MKCNNKHTNVDLLLSQDDSSTKNAKLINEYTNINHGYREAIYITDDKKYYIRLELILSLEGDELIQVYPISQEIAEKYLIKMYIENSLNAHRKKEADKE